MLLDRRKLDIVREANGYIYGRCPACAELGEDRQKKHLVILPSGYYFCYKYRYDEEHERRMGQLAGFHGNAGDFAAIPRPLSPPRPTGPKPLPKLPKLDPLYLSECHRICRTRSWSLDATPGLFALSDRGMLRTGRLIDHDDKWHSAWVITDSSGRSAQAKKMNGQKWECGKVKSLYGSWGDWTIGAADIGTRPVVILCEGMPDFVAALCIAHFEGIPLDEISPVCVTGAGHRIHEDALPHFAGKHVRIFAHPDEAGERAARGWSEQLSTVGAVVSVATFGGITGKNREPVKDLADYLTLLDRNATRPGEVVMRDLWQAAMMTAVDRWTP